MISVEIYKVLHFFALFAFFASAALLLLKDTKERSYKMISGIAAAIILISGMGIKARMGLSMDPWIIGNIIILFVVTGLVHMAAKRFPQKAAQVLWIMVLGMSLASLLAVYKP